MDHRRGQRRDRSGSRCTPSGVRASPPCWTGPSPRSSKPGSAPGEPVPSGTDLGLDRTLAGQQNLALLDTRTGRAYRPLANVSPELFSRCLCTPLFAVLPQLRFGETRCSSSRSRALPAETARIDVALPNLAVVPGVPVTGVGEAPRRADADRPDASGGRRQPRHRRQALHRARRQPRPADRRRQPRRRVARAHVGRVDALLGRRPGHPDPAPSRRCRPAARRRPGRDRGPGERPAPAGAGPSAAPTGVRWTTATYAGLPTYECLCSGLGLWSRGLRLGGGSAHLITQVGPLPAGTDPRRRPVPRARRLHRRPRHPGRRRRGPAHRTGHRGDVDVRRDRPAARLVDRPTGRPRSPTLPRSPTTRAGPSASSAPCLAPDRRSETPQPCRGERPLSLSKGRERPLSEGRERPELVGLEDRWVRAQPTRSGPFDRAQGALSSAVDTQGAYRAETHKRRPPKGTASRQVVQVEQGLRSPCRPCRRRHPGRPERPSRACRR